MSVQSHPDSDLAARHAVAMNWLLGRINYERSGSLPYRARDLKLDRMRELLARLGNPEQAMRIVHVAGTKGKGSTSAMIAAALVASGQRVGLFTSPHLDCVEERIAVNGQLCTSEALVSLIERIAPKVAAMDERAGRDGQPAAGPTYFEITTAMALAHFAECGVDTAVLEVGLGGRLDSTNVCLPAVSVITSISFDHMQQLGNTLAEIAWEKAGIIKPGVPVISGVVGDEACEVIERVARERGCPLVQLGRDYHFEYRSPQDANSQAGFGLMDFHYPQTEGDREYRGLELGLVGRHQAANAAVALATLAELRRIGCKIPETAVRAALRNTTLPARIEVVGRQPTVIVDGAHNVASIGALVAVLDECFPPGRRTLVFGTSSDKDARGMLAALVPRFERIVLTRYLSNPRSVPPQSLDAISAEFHAGERLIYDDPRQAWAYLREQARPTELIVIAGSFFLAGELRRLALEQPIAAMRDQPQGASPRFASVGPKETGR